MKERSSAKHKELFKKAQKAVAAEEADEQARADIAAGKTPAPPMKFVPKHHDLSCVIEIAKTHIIIVKLPILPKV